MIWMVSTDREEGWTGAYASKEIAIADAPRVLDLAQGDVFYVGSGVKLPQPSFTSTSAAWALERLEEEWFDENAGPEEQWKKILFAPDDWHKELANEFTNAFHEWLTKHKLELDWTAIDHIEEAVVP